MVNCNRIFNEIGYDCTPIGKDEVALCTPIDLPEHTPVYAYIKKTGKHIVVTDHGDVFFAALNLGLGDRKRFLNTYAGRIRSLGNDREDEIISVEADIDEGLHVAYAKFLKIVHAAVSYIEERSLLEIKEDELIQNVVDEIRRRNPDVEIKQNVKIKGASGQEHTFSIKANETIIEPLHPSGRTTGPALRRILDIEKAGELPRPIVVLDDSDDAEKARRESQIISSVARVMLLSDLKEGKGPIDLAA